jgi:hypothetical protein
MNTCPVCGFNQLRSEPKNYHICPCCRTEFGNDDVEYTHDELRQRWIYETKGQWWSTYHPAPPFWSPIAQLLNIGYRCNESEINAMKGGAQVEAGRAALDISQLALSNKA